MQSKAQLKKRQMPATKSTIQQVSCSFLKTQCFPVIVTLYWLAENFICFLANFGFNFGNIISVFIANARKYSSKLSRGIYVAFHHRCFRIFCGIFSIRQNKHCSWVDINCNNQGFLVISLFEYFTRFTIEMGLIIPEFRR
jgi:hypothetical protein